LQTISYRQEIQPSDLGAILNIVQGSGFFSNAEVELACELATDRLEHGLQSSYQFLFAENGDRVVGYTCYGLIPATAGSYDLYWIAVAETMRAAAWVKYFCKNRIAHPKHGRQTDLRGYLFPFSIPADAALL